MPTEFLRWMRNLTNFAKALGVSRDTNRGTVSRASIPGSAPATLLHSSSNRRLNIGARVIGGEMAVRFASSWEPPTVQFLTECYRFVAQVWPHLPRDPIPDQGFEQRFRQHCLGRLVGWKLSAAREMNFGASLEPASGVLHEIDLVVEAVASFDFVATRLCHPG